MKKEQLVICLQTSRALPLHIYEGPDFHFCLVFSVSIMRQAQLKFSELK